MTKSSLCTGSAALALALSLAATPAFAEDAPASAPAPTAKAGEEIVVTAEKREQTLLEVPQAITAVSGDTLEQQHATNFSDYVKLVPGLQLDQGRAGESRLIIRGLNTGGVA